MSETVIRALYAVGGTVVTLISAVLTYVIKARGQTQAARSELTDDAMADRRWYRERMQEERDRRKALEQKIEDLSEELTTTQQQMGRQMDRMQHEMAELWHDYHALARTVREISEVDAGPHPKDPPSTLDDDALPDTEELRDEQE